MCEVFGSYRFIELVSLSSRCWSRQHGLDCSLADRAMEVLFGPIYHFGFRASVCQHPRQMFFGHMAQMPVTSQDLSSELGLQ